MAVRERRETDFLVERIDEAANILRSAEPTGLSGAGRMSPAPQIEPKLRPGNTFSLSADRANQIMAPHDGGSLIRQEFRLLKRRLVERLGTNGGARSVLVTGMGDHVGKSFVAANLALTLAIDDGAEVLLVDADGRRHEPLLGEARTPGLTDILSGNVRPEAALYRATGVPLTVLPSGAPHRNASSLAAEDMARLIGNLQRDVDVVLVDAPPLFHSSEIVALATRMGHVLLVLAADQSTQRQVLSAFELLAPYDRISLVLNRTSPKSKLAT